MLVILCGVLAGCGDKASVWTADKPPIHRPLASRIEPFATELWAVDFPTQNVGFAVGERGAVLKTEDAGENWTSLTAGVPNTLGAVRFVDAATGWVAGGTGTILSTRDGGANWTRQSAPTVGFIYALDFVDRDTGWAIGEKGTILSTPDGGRNWIVQRSGVDGLLRSVCFADASHGWIVGNRGLLLGTDNGGRTWLSMATNVKATLIDIACRTRTLWAVGTEGTIIRSADRGRTWVPMSVETGAAFWSVSAIDERNVIALAANDTVHITHDGGQSWSRTDVGSSAALRASHFTDLLHGWVVGNTGAIARTSNGGQSWNVERRPIADDFTSIAATTSKTAFAVTRSGALLKTEDGETWTAVAMPAIERWASVRFASKDVGVLVGAHGAVVRTTDGGQTWHRVVSDVTEDLWSLTLSGRSNGWILGELGTVLCTKNAGETWIAVAHVGKGLTGIVFADNLHGWLMGPEGMLTVTTDGGATWTTQETGTNSSLNSGHFIDRWRGWIVGDDGSILATQDGGAHWQHQSSAVKVSLQSVSFANSLIGWAVGINGTVIYTEDGGKTWETQDSSTTAYLTQVQAIDRTNAFISGRHAVLLRTSNGGEDWYNESPVVEGVTFNEESAWATGEGGSLFVSRNRGQAWRRIITGTVERLWSVAFSDIQNGVAVGARGVIVRSNDGGESWVPLNPPLSSGVLFGVAFAGRTGWIVGQRNTLLRSVDAGQTWSPQQLPPIAPGNLTAIDVSGSLACAAGTGGQVLVTETGGALWVARSAPTETTFNAVSALAPHDCWVVGSRGTVFHTADAGYTWEEQQSATDSDLMGVRFINHVTGWAVGDNGAVQTTTDGGQVWRRTDVRTDVSLRAIGVSARAGIIVGAANAMFLIDRLTPPPYVKTFSSEETRDAVRLRWSLSERDAGEFCDVEARKWANGSWFDIGHGTSEADGKYGLTWKPNEKPFTVENGAQLFYRISISDPHKLGPLWHQEVPTPFLYRTLWARTPQSVRAALMAVAIVAVYFALAGMVLGLAPIAFIYIGRPLSTLIGVLGKEQLSVRLLQLGIDSTFMSKFAAHPRTRAAWVRGFRQGRLELSHLPSDLRNLYVTHEDVRSAWLERYSTGLAELSELEPAVRGEFERHDDVLDAWVARHLLDVSEGLARIGSVNVRNIYIPLPVRFGPLPTSRLVSEPRPDDFEELLSHDVGVIAICGSGGAGKSTLAAVIARSAVQGLVRPQQHQVLPLWLETDSDDIIASIRDELLRCCKSTSAEDVTLGWCGRLLTRRRLLVVVDSLSERDAVTQRSVVDFLESTPAAAVVVTTRLLPDIDIPIQQIWPERIDASTVTLFVAEYVKRLDSEQVLPGREILRLAERLLTIVERGNSRPTFTPLMVKLYVDRALDIMRSQHSLDSLPNSMPEIVIAFLKGINPESGALVVDHDRMLLAARTLAVCALGTSYRPGWFFRNDAIALLEERRLVPSATLIGRIIANGVLTEIERAGTSTLNFELDPVAEYLAALDWLHIYRADEHLWSTAIDKVKAAVGYPDATTGFMTALYDVYSTYREEFDLPSQIGELLDHQIEVTG